MTESDREIRNVPRYLFRTFSPGSDGYSSSTVFRSMAEVNGLDKVRDLSAMTKSQASAMLKDHVLWTSWKNRNDDILISFTSSLLFALQHGVRKIAKRFRTGMETCQVAIVDTARCPDNTFTKTIDLLKKYGLDESQDERLRHQYHEAEYLAQYELDLSRDGEAIVCASFADLVNKGYLFDFIPELGDAESQLSLWNRLEQLRNLWFYAERSLLISDDVASSRTLGLCFGGKWMLITMVWFLIMKSNRWEERLIVDEFGDHFNGTVTTPYLFISEEVEIPESIVELKAWNRLITAVAASQGHRTAELPDKERPDLTELFKTLDLS